jgi:hypothetical protein
MPESTPEQLRFPPVSGFSIRGDFQGGALSSDFGPMLLRGVDQQMGLIERLAGAINDRCHPAYLDHPLPDLLAQRIFFKSPVVMRMAMMPTACVAIRCLSSLSSASRWMSMTT